MKQKIITKTECVSLIGNYIARTTREHIRHQKRARAWRAVNEPMEWWRR